MSGKSKKSETTEVTGKKPPVNSTDRFTNLPELVISHIVSYLGPNDILRMTCLSRNFRNLCLTNPVLDFEAACLGEGKCFCTEICYSINKILFRRHGQTIQRLRVHLYGDNFRCHYYNGVGTLLNLWIRYAVECKVQELDLGCSLDTNFMFPCLDYVKELKLNLSGRYFRLPPKIFPSLVSLTLNNVTSSNSYFDKWFTDTCMNLRTLCLQNVMLYEISISSSSLEQVTVSGWGTQEWEPYTLKSDSSSVKDILISDCNFQNSIVMDLCCSSLRTLTVSGCKFPGHEMSEFVVSAERLEVLRLDLPCQLEPFRDYYIPRFRFTNGLLFLKDAFVQLQALNALGCLIKNHDLALVIDDGSGNGVRSPSGQLDVWSNAISEFYLVPVLFGYGRKQPNFCYLQHLVVIVGRFGGDEDVNISPFLRELENLRTLTLILDKDSVAVADANLMYIMCLRAKNYVTNDGAVKKVVFSLEDNDLVIDLDEDNSGLLESMLNYERVLQSVTFFFGEEEILFPSRNKYRTSTSDYGVFMNSSSIVWSVKKQPTVTTTFSEAKYECLDITTAELFWLRTLFQDPEPRTPRSPSAVVYGWDIGVPDENQWA